MNRRTTDTAGLVLFAAVLLAGPLAAQPAPEVPQPPSTIPSTPSQSPAPVTPLLGTEAVPVGTVVDERPIPGSFQDDYSRDYEARKGFRTYTWQGTALTVFPSTLLWTPPLAVKRDPRMMILASDLKNYRSDYSLDTWIGGTQSILRVEPQGIDFAAQLDIFGVVKSRLSPDDLMLADYRFGLPLSFEWGWWHGKIAYEHTSAHLGDEMIASRGLFVRSFSKDEIVLGIGRYVGDRKNLRVYGHYAYAVQFVVPGIEDTAANRGRFDLGFEWFLREPQGFGGTPFAAANVEWRGDQGHQANINLQAGWMWRNPFTREGQFRVFAEHYTGRSPYGQFFAEKETFTSFGIAFDY